jgi:hypothetical protein
LGKQQECRARRVSVITAALGKASQISHFDETKIEHKCFWWRDAGAARGSTTAVSLHSHTLHSREGMEFIPRGLTRNVLQPGGRTTA